MFFNTKEQLERERLKGYFLGLFSTSDDLSKIKEEIAKMKKTTSNLKKYEMFIKGFISGVKEKNASRLEELRAKRNQSKTNSRVR